MNTLSKEYVVQGRRGSAMDLKIVRLLNPSLLAMSPPAGSRNVLRGQAIEGPGGRWVPCATYAPNGQYYPGLFQVGPGKKQVCAANFTTHRADIALEVAIELARSSAA
jgi:hypothetical protein